MGFFCIFGVNVIQIVMGYILHRFFILFAFLLTGGLLAMAISYVFSFDGIQKVQVLQWGTVAAVVGYMGLIVMQRLKKIKAGRATQPLMSS